MIDVPDDCWILFRLAIKRTRSNQCAKGLVIKWYNIISIKIGDFDAFPLRCNYVHCCFPCFSFDANRIIYLECYQQKILCTSHKMCFIVSIRLTQIKIGKKTEKMLYLMPCNIAHNNFFDAIRGDCNSFLYLLWLGEKFWTFSCALGDTVGCWELDWQVQVTFVCHSNSALHWDSYIFRNQRMKLFFSHQQNWINQLILMRVYIGIKHFERSGNYNKNANHADSLILVLNNNTPLLSIVAAQWNT